MAIKIFVDQGHNPSGPNTGAAGSGLLEQDVTYAVGVYLADLLRADPRFEVRLSRTSPEQILGTSNATSLVERVRLANEWPADYFISIHCNANENPAVNGTEQRRAYVYLPTMYEAQPERRFPVLYMFDGQNVFFNEDATYGKSWGVADYLDYTDTPLIVAAIECNAGANNERLVEYSPYRFDDPTYGHFDGKGQATMSWFIHRFKPLIDQNFRTLPDRAHTFIGGSSMGGLMSLYALLQYNDTYSRAAALSPSIWVAPDKLSGLVGRAKLAPGTVLYMDYGSREMGNHEGIRREFSNLSGKLMTRGIHLTSRIVPGGTHCEASWEKQLPFVFHTLLYEVEE